MRKLFIFLVWTMFQQFTISLYIKPSPRKFEQNGIENKNKIISENEWLNFKSKLDLSDQKVEMLKSQKDQKATADLLNRFIKEHPKHSTMPAKQLDKSAFRSAYHALLKHLLTNKGSFKTSLNFELADKAQDTLKRSTRKIALKMTSDVPTEKIDDLLKMFNQQHALEQSDDDSDNIASDYGWNYGETKESASIETDYGYENLWEDEEYQKMPAKSPSSAKYGSFQDLILQAYRHQKESNGHETQLSNKHFQ